MESGAQSSGTDPKITYSPLRNVSGNERALTGAAGAAMVLLGLKRGSLEGLLVAGLGGVMIQRSITGFCPLYKHLGISTALPAEPGEYFEKGIHVQQSFTINKPAADLFQYWKNFTNLPTFMSHLESVRLLGDNKSRWVAKAPAGRTVQWDAEIINEEPDKLIAWRSLGGADVDNSGSVRFIPAHGDRGTIVKVVLDYIPPAGKVGAIAAKLFGEEPGQQIKDDLRRFKQMMEAGETAVVDQRVRGGQSR